MASFEIEPIQRFSGKSAAIKRPKEIACFSYDDHHQFRLDDSSLRYYWPPRLGADLSAGFESFCKHDDSTDEHLDSLLKTIMAMEKEQGKRCEADIITWRGMMTKIMAAPFDRFNSFEMNATLFQDTIFIEENHSAKVADKERQMRQRPRPGAPPQDLMMYWGYKFETLSVIPDKWDAVSRDQIDNREHEIVNNNAQYCSVARTGIGASNIVIGGEVDAGSEAPFFRPPRGDYQHPFTYKLLVWDCKPDNKEEPIKWVELKTSQELYSDADQLKFERKLLKFWIQSFLLGVPKIIVGFRSKNGILNRLEEFETQKIPGNVKRLGKASWDGNMCISFTATFLDFLKQTITKEGVWRIRRRDKSPVIEVFQVEESGHGRILSPEFFDWRQNLIAREVIGMLS